MVDESLLKSVQKAFSVVKELNEMSIEDLQNICEQYGDKGDNLTVKILKKMQKSNDGFGLHETQATSALLKMAGKTVEKEVPLTENEIKNKSKETK